MEGSKNKSSASSKKSEEENKKMAINPGVEREAVVGGPSNPAKSTNSRHHDEVCPYYKWDVTHRAFRVTRKQFYNHTINTVSKINGKPFGKNSEEFSAEVNRRINNPLVLEYFKIADQVYDDFGPKMLAMCDCYMRRQGLVPAISANDPRESVLTDNLEKDLQLSSSESDEDGDDAVEKQGNANQEGDNGKNNEKVGETASEATTCYANTEEEKNVRVGEGNNEAKPEYVPTSEMTIEQFLAQESVPTFYETDVLQLFSSDTIDEQNLMEF